MLRYTKCLFVLLFCFDICSEELPRIPEDCFANKRFCTSVNIFRESGEKKLNIKVFGKISKSDFVTVEEIVGQYFDFDSWPDYSSDSRSITFVESRPETFTSENGRSFVAHYFDYWIKAPFPLNKMRVAGLSKYENVSQNYPQSLDSIAFSIVGENSRGLKEYWGVIHIAESAVDEDFYNLYFQAVVLPEISIGLGMAGPYIERPLSDIFVGMFGLSE